MKRIGVGLAGGGNIHGIHMLGYRSVHEVKVVAVCALPRDVKPFAEKWGIPKTYTELEDLCKDPEVDMIDIGLPPSLHAKAAVFAAENGKAVLCEKPLARNAREAEEMVAAVEKQNVFNAYLENYTFISWVETAKECLNRGAIGKPVWMRFHLGDGGGARRPWFYRPEISGGGCTMDLGSHLIEVHRWLLGKKHPTMVFGWVDSLVNEEAIKNGVEDYSLVLTKFGDTFSQCETSWGEIVGGASMGFEIAGTEGTFSKGVCPSLKVFSISQNTESLKRFMPPDINKGWFLFPQGGWDEFLLSMTSQMRHVATSYLQNKEPRHIFEDGLIVNKIIDAAYESAKSGKWENPDI